ncbi:methyltransferase domain-containing protein [Iocasia frigidifontis]|uniref:Methyltransferase domain-containing protein n=1 Tax=Iocasia fonsfrigidae TaxID=2682810 RepID=A0A8A7K706_9FIRM|nr:class I SAM-dependent methyltransferase [Iocasia fonsfrigidae]QTL97181.1 methyltransferase domain-containing protein [Iocasia fonsfrigidae]
MEKKAYTEFFAQIYDNIMGAVPYKLWFEYIHDILNYYQCKADSVLDLACGTGTMSLLFNDQGYYVTGIDRSQDMLAVAEGKIDKRSNIDFAAADLREFTTVKKYDLAICLFDSLNYILTAKELFEVFNQVFSALNDHGLFIFDMNTITRLMSIKSGTTMFHGEGYSCFWEDIVDQKQERWKVRLKIYLDNRDECYEELHEERGYLISDVISLLQKAGFNKIDVFSAYTFNKGRDNDNRLYYTAFKKAVKMNQFSLAYLFRKMKWRVKSFLSAAK